MIKCGANKKQTGPHYLHENSMGFYANRLKQQCHAVWRFIFTRSQGNNNDSLFLLLFHAWVGHQSHNDAKINTRFINEPNNFYIEFRIIRIDEHQSIWWLVMQPPDGFISIESIFFGKTCFKFTHKKCYESSSLYSIHNFWHCVTIQASESVHQRIKL